MSKATHTPGPWWHSQNEQPVDNVQLFVLNHDNTIDWIESERRMDVSEYKGWMYFSDLCKVLSFAPNMLEALTELIDTHSPDQVCKGCKNPPYCPCGKLKWAEELHKIVKRIIKKAEGWE